MTRGPVTVDVNLFAGAGGFALGVAMAGFDPSVYYEVDQTAWRTLKRNGLIKADPPGWPSHMGDVSKVDWCSFPHRVRLLFAGVPCQPFSLAGKHLADRDGRNNFPELLRAIRQLRPQAVLVENVYGLLRGDFRPYFEYVIRALQSPSVLPKRDELWQTHDRRLRAAERAGDFACDYRVSHSLLDAADFGVPQTRRRVFIVATLAGLPAYAFPKPSHSRDALIRAQLSGAYWRKHGLRIPRSLGSLFHNEPKDDQLLPWVTVRDAISNLPDAAETAAAALLDHALPNHWRIRGARSYPGHSGSVLDWPSKTIKAGVHGVPGGENTVRLGPKSIRYYTLREAATIQTFPTNFRFEGARARVTRQVGNAVPPVLAFAVAYPLARLLLRSGGRHSAG
jgi:DNA (cytosine-5)-methyltransferase 1